MNSHARQPVRPAYPHPAIDTLLAKIERVLAENDRRSASCAAKSAPTS